MPSSTSPSTSSSQALTHTPNLTLHAAQAALRACQSTALANNTPMNIAILDSSLHLLAFARMPNAKLTSISIAIDKAFTAAGHRNPTSAYKEKVWPGGAVYGINHSNGGRFTTIGGGVPVVVDGVCVGAVGCSSGTPEEDGRVAQAGVDAIMELLQKEKADRPLKAKL